MVRPCILEVTKSSYNQLAELFFSSVFSKIYDVVNSSEIFLLLSSFSSFHLHTAKTDRPKEYSCLSVT